MFFGMPRTVTDGLGAKFPASEIELFGLTLVYQGKDTWPELLGRLAVGPFQADQNKAVRLSGEMAMERNQRAQYLEAVRSERIKAS